MNETIKKAVEWAIRIAEDNSHGYSQVVRWSPSYDCSSLVISAWEQAGVPVKSKGNATYTGNMRNSFLANGFVEYLPSSFDFNNYNHLEYGDVLLNHANHTAIYIGDGKIVHARSSEGTTDTKDNSGNEIRTQSYFNYPWDCVLRYKGNFSSSVIPTNSIGNETLLIPNGCKGIGIAMLQGALKYLGYSLGWYGIDGDAGYQNSYTNKATRQAIESGKLTKETVEYLVALCKKGG